MAATDGELNILALQSSDSMDWGSDFFDEEDMAEGAPSEEGTRQEEAKVEEEVEVSLSPVLKNLLGEVGLDESKSVTMKHSMKGGLFVVEASCAVDRETRETVKLARSSRSEATEAADRKLVAKLRKRYFPAQATADTEMVEQRETLARFCTVTKMPQPRYSSNTDPDDGCYYSKVTVGRDDMVEGGLSNFLLEAEGMAAKAWLLVHGGNWKEVLEDKRGSQVFGQEELEAKRGSQVFGQEELDTKRGGQEERQVEPPLKMPTKVVTEPKAKTGLAALDGMSQGAALAASTSAAGGVTQASARLGCRVLDRLHKKEEPKPRKAGGKVEKRDKKELLKRAMCHSTSSTDEDWPKVEQEKVESKSPKRKKQKETVKPNLEPHELGKDDRSKSPLKLVQTKSADVKSALDGVGEKLGPKKSVGKKKIFAKTSDDSEEEKLKSPVKVVRTKSVDVKSALLDGVGVKLSPKKTVGKKPKKIFARGSDESEEEKSESFSFQTKPAIKTISKVSKSQPKIRSPDVAKTVFFTSSFIDDEEKSASSRPKAQPKAKKKVANISSMSPTSPGEEKFQFSSQDKKAKESTVEKKKAESKSKTVKKGAKAMRDEDSPPVASGSGVFDHEDDPYVKEIVKRQKKEAKDLHKRSKVESNGSRRQSVAMAKMAKYQMSQSESDEKEAFKKPIEAKRDEVKSSRKVKKTKKKEEGDKAQPKIGGFFKSTKTSKSEISKDDETDSVSDGFSPDIDDLLKLPERPEDGGKTKEEILDELDAEIRRRQKKHDIDMAKVDEEIEGERKKREERKTRLRENALLRNRLEKELTETEMRSTFKANLGYLQSIHDGLTPSARHKAFHKSVRTRQALYYTMITDPFTDDQLNWTLEEMSKVWMRNKREQMDNNEYVWKVLLPECFIKVYGDKFGVSRAEAEVMIGETPLHLRDEPRLEMDSTEGETEEDE